MSEFDSVIKDTMQDKEFLQQVADDFFAKMRDDPDAFLEQMARETCWMDGLDSWEVRELCGLGEDL